MQKARDALVEHDITTREQLRGVADHELADWFIDGRSHAQGDFVPIDFDAVAKARTGRNKVTLQVLWVRYTAQPAAQASGITATSGFASLWPNTLMPLG